MDIFKKKVIPAKKVRQFYKRFANGEQYIEFSPISGNIEEIAKQYYWQRRSVYNHIKPLIDIYGNDMTDEQLYGRYGLVSLLEPYQREYNRIMNLQSEHICYATFGYVTAEDGSIDADELCEDGLVAGKLIIYRQGGKEPEVKKDTIDTVPYLKSAEYCLNRMVQIAVDFFESHSGKESLK